MTSAQRQRRSVEDEAGSSSGDSGDGTPPTAGTEITVGPAPTAPDDDASATTRKMMNPRPRLDFRTMYDISGINVSSDAMGSDVIPPLKHPSTMTTRRRTRQRRSDQSAVAQCDRGAAGTSSSADPGSLPETSEATLFGPEGTDDRADYAPERFSVGVFAYEVFIHVFFPISLPLVLFRHGVVGARAKYFLPRADGVHVLVTISVWVSQLLQLAPTVLSFVFGISWLLPLSIICFGFPIFRIITIAGKYAAFSREDYRRKMLDPTYVGIDDVLIASWYKQVPESKILSEFCDAEQYTAVDLGELPLLRLLGGATCCPRRYLSLLLHRVYRAPPTTLATVVVNIAALATVLAPFAAYWVHFNATADQDHAFLWGSSIPGSPAEVAATLTLAVQLYNAAPPTFLFMYIALIHHWRGHRVQRTLIDAVMPSGHTRICGDGSMIRLTTEGNLFVWDRLRHVARHFGRVYSNRISFNTIATVAVSAITFAKLAFERLVFGAELLNHDHIVATVFVVHIFVCASLLGALGMLFAVLTNRCDVLAAEVVSNEELALFFRTHNNNNNNAAAAVSVPSDDNGHGNARSPLQIESVDDGDIDRDRSARNTDVGGSAAMSPSDPDKSPATGEEDGVDGGSDDEGQAQYFRLKAVRSAIGMRNRVEPVEIMYAPARPKMLSAYLAFLVSAATLLIALLVGPSVG